MGCQEQTLAARALYTNTIILPLSRVRSYRLANPPLSLPRYPLSRRIPLCRSHSLSLSVSLFSLLSPRGLFLIVTVAFLVDLTLEEPAHFRVRAQVRSPNIPTRELHDVYFTLSSRSSPACFPLSFFLSLL